MNIRLKISEIITETRDTKTFILLDLDNQIKEFLPGQYLTLLINSGSDVIKRSYSISSIPENLPYIRISIKDNKNNPTYTNFSHNLSVGDIIIAEPITGKFYVVPKTENEKNYLFIAAGSGITPIISMLRSVLEIEKKSKVILLYQNRLEDCIIYQEEISELNSKYLDKFVYNNFFSRPNDSKNIPAKRLNENLLNQIYTDNKNFFEDAEVYICGPEGFISSVLTILEKFDLKKEKFHREI